MHEIPESAVPALPRRSPLLIAWLVVSWLWVGLPLAWGVYRTSLNAWKLFE